MLERSKQRVKDSHTLYLNNTHERELQYQDYFETEEELEKKDGVREYQRAELKAKLFAQDDMRLENIDFNEEDDTAHADHEGIIQKKIFKYKYRQAVSTPEQHQRRETRMLSKMVQP